MAKKVKDKIKPSLNDKMAEAYKVLREINAHTLHIQHLQKKLQELDAEVFKLEAKNVS